MEQSKRLDCPLYIDISRFSYADPLDIGYRKETPRSYELGSLNHSAVVLETDSPWFENSPRRPGFIRRIGSRSSKLHVYRQPSLDFHDEINQVRPGTTLFGYFQSWKYFENVQSNVHDLLVGQRLSTHEKKLLDTLSTKDHIVAHVRRGDYLSGLAFAHHGIATADYFHRSSQMVRRILGKHLPVTVFSDSPDLVREELAHLEDTRVLQQSKNMSPAATILAMSRSQGFVMSNSSFSWWAAWLLSQTVPDAPVIAPRPWTADGQSGHDQLLPGWITMDAR